MPYLTENEKKDVAGGKNPEKAGELNYLLTLQFIKYISNTGLTYKTINDVMGASVGALLEFYARVARQYEDTKIQTNGDVYPGWMTGNGVPPKVLPGPEAKPKGIQWGKLILLALLFLTYTGLVFKGSFEFGYTSCYNRIESYVAQMEQAEADRWAEIERSY